MKKGILFLTLVISILFMTACSENTDVIFLNKSSVTNEKEQTTISKSDQSLNTNKVEEEGVMKLIL